MKLLLLIHSALAGFTTIGCFSTTLQPQPLNPLTAENCANKCLEESVSLSFMTVTGCGCVNVTDAFIRQNDAECNGRCEDGSPCGGRERVSLYELTKPISPTVSMMPPAATITNTGSVDATIGKGNSLNQKQIALYASIGAAAVIIIIGVIWFIKRKKRQESIPTLPRHGSRNKEFLIPNVPKTTNLVYSVHREYRGKEGEMDVNVDDVVCLQQYKGDWGIGVNVTTGQKGRVPLAAFVDLKFDATMPPFR